MRLSQKRRVLLAAGLALASHALPTRTQPSPRHVVGFLSGGTRSDVAGFLTSFREAMRELGYREGQNLVLEARYSEYSAERAQKLAAELAALQPRVIVANGGGIGPACRLTPPLPVAFLISGDPVDAGFADSYARPGRNATGVTLLALDLIVKRLEVLKQINPKMRKVVFLASPEHAGQKRDAVAQREQAHVLHDVLEAIEKEDDAHQEHQVVVSGDHVLRAQIHQGPDGRTVEPLQIHGVLARHAVCLERRRQQRDERRQR